MDKGARLLLWTVSWHRVRQPEKGMEGIGQPENRFSSRFSLAHYAAA
ncbi:hypothetical protein GCWU000324_03125 [Kingella oralis ATCC 51147]|uniref:Uncharacterized protein n=1 Tax=Kingella oralis ATCC 51147 TaxID=629741 RepID=C4GN36_9NEIS|nr:hypothetical protein GCWU000324_03125 [Kingella oralis ATCC 51147]